MKPCRLLRTMKNICLFVALNEKIPGMRHALRGSFQSNTKSLSHYLNLTNLLKLNLKT